MVEHKTPRIHALSADRNEYDRNKTLLDKADSLGMRIRQRILVKFYEEHANAKAALEVWHSDARKAEWKIPDNIKKLYASASFLKDNRVVFNIKGNDYRLIVHIDYLRKIVRVKFIGTHSQYDKINAEEI